MKNVLFFIGGVIVGGVVGVLGTKKYFQDKYQKRYEADHAALEEYYHRTDEYTRSEHKDEEEFEERSSESNETDSNPGGRMTPEERSEIKKKLDRNWKGTTNYAAMYRGKRVETDPVDDTNDSNTCITCGNYDPEAGICRITNNKVNEDDGCIDFEKVSPLESLEEIAFDEHQKNKNQPPKIISEEMYSNLPAWFDQEVLYLYAYDEVLTDDNMEMIDDPGRLIGDALTEHDFIDNNEQIMFVINYSLSTCYEIQKLNAAWSDSH